MNYLDHINGKRHQRRLGFSMRVERSSVGDVRARFGANLQKRKRDELAGGDGKFDITVDDWLQVKDGYKPAHRRRGA